MGRKLTRFLITALLLSSCAINDVPGASPASTTDSAQPQPELVLNPPGELKLEGDCNVTSQLEAWLQVTMPVREDFAILLSAAVAKSASEMHDDVLSLVTLRNTVYSTPTPDCALESQILLSSAINESVDTLQAVVNGHFTGDLATTLIDVNDQLTRVAQLQNDLIKRMESQYQAQTPSQTGG